MTSVRPSQNGCDGHTRRLPITLVSPQAAHRERAGGDGHERELETGYRARFGSAERTGGERDSESGHGTQSTPGEGSSEVFMERKS